LLRAPGYQRVPKTRTADCEADESGHAGRRLQPFMNLVVVLAAPQGDASHFVAAIPPGGGDDPLAILTAIEPLDLPDVRLDARILQFLDCPHHEPRTEFAVVGFLIAVQPIQ